MKQVLVKRWLPSVVVVWYFTAGLLFFGGYIITGVVMGQFMGALLIGYLIFWGIHRLKRQT